MRKMKAYSSPMKYHELLGFKRGVLAKAVCITKDPTFFKCPFCDKGTMRPRIGTHCSNCRGWVKQVVYDVVCIEEKR